jgi:hypothetical protein
MDKLNKVSEPALLQVETEAGRKFFDYVGLIL